MVDYSIFSFYCSCALLEEVYLWAYDIFSSSIDSQDIFVHLYVYSIKARGVVRGSEERVWDLVIESYVFISFLESCVYLSYWVNSTLVPKSTIFLSIIDLRMHFVFKRTIHSVRVHQTSNMLWGLLQHMVDTFCN